MKKVLVLGSNSFSGQDFVRHLLQLEEYEIVGVSRLPRCDCANIQPSYGKIKFETIDINNDFEKLRTLILSLKPNFIVNFAAQSEVAPSWEHPECWFQTNVVALANLIRFLSGSPFLEKFVQISSPEIYGSTSTGVTEKTAIINPSTPYAVSKAAADYLLQCYFKEKAFPVCFVRSTNVYGAHQQIFKLIPRTVLAVMEKKKMELHGGGVAVKSYINIKDVSAAEELILKHGKPGEVYHVSPDHSLSVKEVVEFICREMGVDPESVLTNVAERPGQDAAYVLSSSKLKDLTGWKANVSFKNGISEVINWIEKDYNCLRLLPRDYVHRK